MVKRVLEARDIEQSRCKGVDDALKIVQSFSPETGVDERIETLSNEFQKCSERCLDPILDNFETYDFFQRGNHRKGADLKALLLGAFKAASKMEEIVRQMDLIGRGKMNGHTQLFLEQREKCDDSRYRLQVAKELYISNGFGLCTTVVDRVSHTIVSTAADASGRISRLLSSYMPRLHNG